MSENAEIRKFILTKNAEIRKFILTKNAEICKFILMKNAEIRKFILHLSKFLFFSTLSVYFSDSNISTHNFVWKCGNVEGEKQEKSPALGDFLAYMGKLL